MLAGRGRCLIERWSRGVDVERVPERDRMLGLERRELVAVHRVRRLASGDAEGGLPETRVDPERRLEPRRRALAQHRRPLEPVARDRLPAHPRTFAGREGADSEECRDIGSDPDRGERPAVAPHLVHAERRADLLDALPEGFDEIRERVRVAGRERMLEQEVRVHRICAEAERDHDVVQVAHAPRREQDRALAP